MQAAEIATPSADTPSATLPFANVYTGTAANRLVLVGRNRGGEKLGCTPLNNEAQRADASRASASAVGKADYSMGRAPMTHLLMHVTLAVAAATVIGPVQAQTPSPLPAAPQWPPAAYFGSSHPPYPLPAATPRDAYREGLINRWELEQIEGPQPQALQGPSVDGTRGGGGGDSRGN